MKTIPRLTPPWQLPWSDQILRYSAPATVGGATMTETLPVDASEAADSLFAALDEVLPEFVSPEMIPMVLRILNEHPIFRWLSQFRDRGKNSERLAAANYPTPQNTASKPEPSRHSRTAPRPATRPAAARPEASAPTSRPSRQQICRRAARHALLHRVSFEAALDEIESRVA